jgi:hypothetical protein
MALFSVLRPTMPADHPSTRRDMRAAIFNGPGQIDVGDRPDPAISQLVAR